MSIAHDLFGQVSIGEENAVTSHLLWKHLGMWSPARIKQRLNEMAADGLIQRKRARAEEITSVNQTSRLF